MSSTKNPHRTAQTHAEHRGATDIKNKLYVYVCRIFIFKVMQLYTTKVINKD